MQAYLNDPALKARLLSELEKHRTADAIVQRIYGESFDNTVGFRGCAVGCTLHSLEYGLTNDHAAYETLLGIPRALARIQDAIFEGLPIEEARLWPAQFAGAISAGADLTGVVDRFLLAVLTGDQFGVLRYARTDKTRDAIVAVARLYERKIAGEVIDRAEWHAAYAAAAAGAAYAAAAAGAAYAYAAAAAAAAYAAAAYADAAAYAAAAAYADAADAAYAARRFKWSQMRDYLLTLLATASTEHKVLAQ